jgi:hypothetical protein
MNIYGILLVGLLVFSLGQSTAEYGRQREGTYGVQSIFWTVVGLILALGATGVF